MRMPLLLLLLALQQDPDKLIEKFRSEAIAERDEAAARLKAMGRAALPALQKAAKGSDPVIAANATAVLRKKRK